MKIRLTQPGFEHYNGQMGVMWFEDGLSTADVNRNDARRMAATMLCEWEDGTSPSVTQDLLDAQLNEAPVFKAGDAQHDPDAAVANRETAVREFAADPSRPATTTWTREQLSLIADKDGIKGLRAISEPMDIKGNSIRELIEKILLRQPRAADTPDFS